MTKEQHLFHLNLLKKDATNRTLRTLWQGLAYTVGAAILTFAWKVLGGWDMKDWSYFEMDVLGKSLAQTVGMAVIAYLMRRFIDPSRVPTPLPPSVTAQPADPEPVQEAVQETAEEVHQEDEVTVSDDPYVPESMEGKEDEYVPEHLASEVNRNEG